MKHRRNWMLALLIALALVMSVFAVAENLSGDLEVALDDGVAGQQPSGGLELEDDGASGTTPDIEDNPVADGGMGLDGLSDLSIGDLVSDAPEAVVVYRFLVNGAEYAAQTAKAG